MTRKPLLSKLNIAMIVLLIAASAILVTENVTGATIRDSLAGFTRVNEDVVPAESSLTRLERRYELARIKDDVFPANLRPRPPGKAA